MLNIFENTIYSLQIGQNGHYWSCNIETLKTFYTIIICTYFTGKKHFNIKVTQMLLDCVG